MNILEITPLKYEEASYKICRCFCHCDEDSENCECIYIDCNCPSTTISQEIMKMSGINEELLGKL